MSNVLTDAVGCLKKGGVIAYPTESVYGLGCDPFNEAAVQRLLEIKQRPVEKGLILLASDWEQLKPYIDTSMLSAEKLAAIKATTHTTWLFPKTKNVPAWIHGNSQEVAVRVTTLPLAKELCQAFGKPIVSTSANFSGEDPVKYFADLDTALIDHLDYVLEGETGPLAKPTIIKNAMDGRVIR
ncbi:MAG: threonylcarbamoyl-AMP synthase [Gammaproteobacteria bacterium]|nr:threonylcarbamoyl-AMP synthase [Gammaproteobacteria bacterium]